MGADTLRERGAIAYKKAERAALTRMCEAALGSRGKAPARGSPEGCRVTALWRGFRGEQPRVTRKREVG